MSSLNLRGVHVYKKVPGRNAFALSEINPVLILNHEDSKVFIQKGEFFSAGGQRLKKADLPAWLDEELGKCNPDALREAGLVKAPKAPSEVN